MQLHDGVVWVLNEVSIGCSVKLFLYCQGLLEKLWVEGREWERKEEGKEEGEREGKRGEEERKRREEREEERREEKEEGGREGEDRRGEGGKGEWCKRLDTVIYMYVNISFSNMMNNGSVYLEPFE